MSQIKVFISYSSKQKVIGGRFRHYLMNFCGYKTFIAHDDIPASSVWEEEIMKAIEDSDFFIPLLSKDFKISDFTDQETGIAVNLKKRIIPIKLDSTNPYGFINKYQAMQYKTHQTSFGVTDNVKELVLAIVQIGLRYDEYHEKTINSLVHAFCESDSFEATNTIIEILSHYDRLTSTQLKQIQQAIKSNPQIYNAWGLENFKKFLHNKYRISVD